MTRGAASSSVTRNWRRTRRGSTGKEPSRSAKSSAEVDNTPAVSMTTGTDPTLNDTSLLQPNSSQRRRQAQIAHADVDPEAVRSTAAFDQHLTLREVEVLMLLVEGASNKVIARRLDFGSHRQVPCRPAARQWPSTPMRVRAMGWVGSWRMISRGTENTWEISGGSFNEALGSMVRGMMMFAAGTGAHKVSERAHVDVRRCSARL